MATSYSVVVVIVLVLCGLCMTSQACGPCRQTDDCGPDPWPQPWGPWEPFPDPRPRPYSFRRRREVQIDVERREQLVRYAREIMGQDDAATQKNIFQAIDMDSDGSISLSEWSRADVIHMIDLFCSPPQNQEKGGD